MPRNLTTGVYSPPAGTFATFGTTISSSAYNAFVTDLGSEITSSIDPRGETPMSAPLNLGSNKLLNVATGTASTDGVNVGQLSSLMPAGAIIDWPTSTPPTGWFIRNGQAVSRTGNPNLFSLIGTTFGTGDGSTTFNVPNDIDKVVIASGNLYTIGSTGGSASTTLATGNLPAHNHAVTDPGHAHTTVAHTHSVSDPGHSHTVPAASYTVAPVAGAGTAVTGTTSSGGAYTGIALYAAAPNTNTATTGITTANTGSATSFTNLPPYRAYLPIIKGG